MQLAITGGVAANIAMKEFPGSKGSTDAIKKQAGTHGPNSEWEYIAAMALAGIP